MDTSNLFVGHLAWCGLVALNMARQSGMVSSPAQENLFLCRWLAKAEKKRLFRRELAGDIRWLLKEGREKGLRADLPGKLEYLWQASSGDLLAQNALFRLQHVMHAITLTGINYGVLDESEWEGSRAVKVSPKVPGLFIRKSDLDTGFNENGCQVKPISVRITADLPSVDVLLSRAGWERQSGISDAFQHFLTSISDEK
ncbi:DUF2913 family protein [Pantoea agglomerans]|uniref:DUF2913 family protein n=1 Tax=Enterobacter agglomerans TaxID=549 RepID=UPI001F32FD70|nr:DUF2913 family protein [Pantoea agglomerans]MDK4218986.1 DUF2913 family protein [Pantoea agglomerans]UJL39251.1 DUF2913 family protein [Pantoea agglomerans]